MWPLSKLPNLNIAEYPSLPTKMCSSTSPAMLASCIQTMHPVGRGILKLFTGNRMKTTWSDLFQFHPIANHKCLFRTVVRSCKGSLVLSLAINPSKEINPIPSFLPRFSIYQVSRLLGRVLPVFVEAAADRSP